MGKKGKGLKFGKRELIKGGRRRANGGEKGRLIMGKRQGVLRVRKRGKS